MDAATTSGTAPVAAAFLRPKPGGQKSAWTPVRRLYASFFLLLLVLGVLALSTPLAWKIWTNELRSTDQVTRQMEDSEAAILEADQMSVRQNPQAGGQDEAHGDAAQRQLAALEQHLTSYDDQLQTGATTARTWHTRIDIGGGAAAAILLACLLWCYLLNLRWGKKAIMQGTLISLIVCTASFGWLWRAEKEYSRHLEQAQARALTFASASFLEKALPTSVVLVTTAAQIRVVEDSVLSDLQQADAQVKYAPFVSIGFLLALLVYWLTVRAATREYREPR
jgi:hypothetical protein